MHKIQIKNHLVLETLNFHLQGRHERGRHLNRLLFVFGSLLSSCPTIPTASPATVPSAPNWCGCLEETASPRIDEQRQIALACLPHEDDVPLLEQPCLQLLDPRLGLGRDGQGLLARSLGRGATQQLHFRGTRGGLGDLGRPAAEHIEALLFAWCNEHCGELRGRAWFKRSNVGLIVSSNTVNGATDGLKWHEGETWGSRADLGVCASSASR